MPPKKRVLQASASSKEEGDGTTGITAPSSKRSRVCITEEPDSFSTDDDQEDPDGQLSTDVLTKPDGEGSEIPRRQSVCVSTVAVSHSGDEGSLPVADVENDGPVQGKKIFLRLGKMKTAVRVTHKKSVIAIIERNRKESPLLSLPFEVRDKILRALYGDRCIHIMCLASGGAMPGPRLWTQEQGSLGDSKLRLLNYVCEHLPLASFQETMLGKSGHSIGHNCHANCLYPGEPLAAPFAESGRYAGDPRVEPLQNTFDTDSFGLFSTCRQTYEEASTVFWSTNAFVFQDLYTLPMFLGKLNTTQRGKLWTVHIQASVYASGGLIDKRKGINAHAVQHLRSIDNLSIDFHLCYEGFTDKNDAVYHAGSFWGFENLQQLNPKRFNMNISNVIDGFLQDPDAFLDNQRKANEAFTANVMNENYATELREKKEANRAALLAKEAEIRERNKQAYSQPKFKVANYLALVWTSVQRAR